ncbi:transglycosylase SLT domain-containing protein [Streptomyces sp. NPDC057654]|uniref:aggregation-promoting factor C-terminal-like domain-containing protein n=1 Tax=Streptomyces sp. NPDC057654 TaxID=3346196 RepID=UPI0036B268BC
MTSRTISRIAPRTKTAAAAATVALGAAGVVFASVPAQAAAPAAPKAAAPKAAATSSPQAAAHKLIPDAAQYQCFSNIVEHESGWNPTASNPSGAYGLVQALPASKMASAGADYKTNPETQIKWGLEYMNSTYGSPCAAWSFWQSHNWY